MTVTLPIAPLHRGNNVRLVLVQVQPRLSCICNDPIWTGWLLICSIRQVLNEGEVYVTCPITGIGHSFNQDTTSLMDKHLTY